MLFFFFFFSKFILFLAVLGLRCCARALVAVSGGYSSLQCTGFSLQWLLCCGARDLGARTSVVVALRLHSCGSRALECRLSSCGACGIFLDQGSNPCPLHWQVDS